MEFVAPTFQMHPLNAPPMLPVLFITIACGAVSGFHCLVSSGTTAKQLDRETDARFGGYGGMRGESLLGLLAGEGRRTALPPLPAPPSAERARAGPISTSGPISVQGPTSTSSASTALSSKKAWG